MTFVGRGREVHALQDELDAVRLGRPRVVIVEGPPGIGKTTLVERFLATLDDVRVARASGDEFETDVDFGVLDQLLRHGAPSDPPAGHVEAGGRLLELIGELQAAGPAIVFVDDAHWADRESLKALQFAVRRLVDDAVLVLLAVREGESEHLPEGLLKIAAGRTGTRLTLTPLDVPELRALAAGLGVEISLGGARRLHEHSGGSPLHARGLLTELPAQVWEEARTSLPAPRGFASLVATRLRALPEDSVRLLEAASVLGVRTGLAVAAGIGGVEEPFEALEAPVAAHLIELDDGPDVRFAHPLIRAAVYQQLSPARRARLHLAVAAIADDEGTALGHRVAASAGADAGLAAELEAFAARATQQRRWASVLSSLLAASRLSESREDRERRMLGAVEAAMYAGDGPRARALAETTEGFAPGPLLDSVLAYVATGTGRRAEAELRLERAWERREATLGARIAERMAFLEIVRVRPAAAVEWAQRARALAPGDDTVRAQTSWLLALGLHWSGRPAEGYALIEREEATPASITGSLRLADDDLVAARAALAPSTARGARVGSLVVSARGLARHAQVEFAAGEWDDAVVLAERALVIATESDEVAAQALARWAAVLVPAGRGEFEVCDAHVGALEALSVVFEAHIAEARIGRAEVAAAQGRHADVLEVLGPLADVDPHGGIGHPGHLPWAHLYADALVTLERDADDFLTTHERIAAAAGSRLMTARLARVRAARHALRDEPAEADAAFALALETVPGDMPYEQALIELAHGRFLRRSGRRRDAAAVLSAARERLAALGATPMLERCVRELDACGLTPVKRNERADRTRLTPQERSVARLVAAGLTNRELAAELLLSVKTVERHLTHIYRKAGVESRAELANLVRAGG